MKEIITLPSQPGLSHEIKKLHKKLEQYLCQNSRNQLASFVINMFPNKVKRKLTSAGAEVRGFLCRGAAPWCAIKTLEETYVNKQ